MSIFNDENLKFISDMIEEKMPILKECEDFKTKYESLFDSIENLEQKLTNEQKDELDEIVSLFYQTESYYLVLAYSLGVKYGKEIEKL